MTLRRMFFALVATAGLIAGGCADFTQPALEVNGTEFSRTELVELIEDIGPPTPAGAEEPPAGIALGSTRSTAVAVLIENVLIRDEMDRTGVTITDGDRAEATRLADQVILGPTAQFTEDGRAFVEESLQVRTALSRELGDQYGQRIADLLGEADVEIDPRFGTWIDGLGYQEPGLSDR